MNHTASDYDTLHANFRWSIPREFNLAEACCGRWAKRQPRAVALRYERINGLVDLYSYGQLQRAANQLAHRLRQEGVGPGDRVAIVLPQCFETAVAHIAAYQLGAVAMPLSLLFGPEALSYRLQDSGAVLALVDECALTSVRLLRADLPALRTVLVVSGQHDAVLVPGEQHYEQALRDMPVHFDGVSTLADDAAVLIYTSGTTGPPKGALIPHRALIGNLPGFVCSQNWFGFACFNGQAVAGVAPDESRAVFWS
ncbi:MAG: AMP-binding protein, partial [Burkholderiaceae bacterium]